MDNKAIIAMEMLKQHTIGSRFENLSQDFMPKTVQDAYESQDYFQKFSTRGELGGFKIALASKVQQNLTGIKHPLYGGIFSSEILPSPAKIEFKKCLGLGLEFELAITLLQDLPKGHQLVTERSVIKYIKSIYPAFEIIIDRNADYSNLDALSMVVDNVWCGGVVLGDPIKNWESMDLNKLEATLNWNEEDPVKALTGDANPIKSLVWVINSLLTRNIKIPKGSLFITGSVMKTRKLNVGDIIEYKIGNNSKVQLEVD